MKALMYALIVFGLAQSALAQTSAHPFAATEFKVGTQAYALDMSPSGCVLGLVSDNGEEYVVLSNGSRQAGVDSSGMTIYVENEPIVRNAKTLIPSKRPCF